MAIYPEIDCPEAHDLYHDKGVMFRVKSGGRVETWKGKFCVAESSKWMRIDVVVPGTENGVTEQQFPISQETLETIRPAPKLVMEQAGTQVAFVIPQILPLPDSSGPADYRRVA
jgi:hypothetical protein